MQTDKIIAYIRQNLFALLLGAGVLCTYFYFTLSGRECFNCEQTQTYKPNQSNHSGLRFRHK